jgi:hypothetical protein
VFADQSAVPATCGKSVPPLLREGQDCGMVDKQWFAVRTIVANNENRSWGSTNLDPGQITTKSASPSGAP